MKLGNIRRLMREDMPDAPSGEWLDTLLQVLNQANEQTTQGLQGGVTLGDNTTSGYGLYRFTHGQELIIRNPLKVRPVGIEAIRVIATPGGAAALPIAGSPLWRFVDSDDPRAPQQLGITALFDNSRASTGYAGEQSAAISRLPSATTALTTNVTKNVCATPSIALSAGSWLTTAFLGFSPAATTSITRLIGTITKTSASLPASDSFSVPLSGEVQVRHTIPASVIVNATSLTIPPTPITVADGATQDLYLAAQATFTVSTLDVWGWMQAVRVLPYLTGYQADVVLFFHGG